MYVEVGVSWGVVITSLHFIGLYCSGWVKTGPVGVILNTMNNAFETAENIVKDYTEGEELLIVRNYSGTSLFLG